VPVVSGPEQGSGAFALFLNFCSPFVSRQKGKKKQTTRNEPPRQVKPKKPTYRKKRPQ
jgi:hypothetical protein